MVQKAEKCLNSTEQHTKCWTYIQNSALETTETGKTVKQNREIKTQNTKCLSYAEKETGQF